MSGSKKYGSSIDELEYLQKIVDERYKLLRELRKLSEALGTPREKEVQREILRVLKKLSRLRRTMEKKIESVREIDEETTLEYVTTLFDYIRLVDMDVENEILQDLLRYAETNEGPLKENKDWIQGESSNVSILISKKLASKKSG